MFIESLSLLTREQKHALHDARITSALLADWKAGRRLPTEPQAVIYANVAGIERHALQDELAMLRATPEQRTLLARVLGKALASATSKSLASLGALALTICIASGFARPAEPHGMRLKSDNV